MSRDYAAALEECVIERDRLRAHVEELETRAAYAEDSGAEFFADAKRLRAELANMKAEWDIDIATCLELRAELAEAKAELAKVHAMFATKRDEWHAHWESLTAQLAAVKAERDELLEVKRHYTVLCQLDRDLEEETRAELEPQLAAARADVERWKAEVERLKARNVELIDWEESCAVLRTLVRELVDALYVLEKHKDPEQRVYTTDLIARANRAIGDG